MNAGSINCGLMKNVHNFRGSRLKRAVVTGSESK